MRFSAFRFVWDKGSQKQYMIKNQTERKRFNTLNKQEYLFYSIKPLLIRLFLWLGLSVSRLLHGQYEVTCDGKETYELTYG